MYRKYYEECDDDDDDYVDFENREIIIEDDTWESIRKRAAETGEDPNVIAERFIEEIRELRANRSETDKAWCRLVAYRKKQRKLGIDSDNETEPPEVVKEWRRLAEFDCENRNVLKKAV